MADKVKVVLQTVCDDMDWICLAQDTGVPLHKVMNLWGP
jgi:hypothetical protein